MSADDAYRVARAFVSALAENGVEVVAIGAGSRSTPMTLAFVDDGRFRCFSFVDERSAGFFALGAARATGRPAAVLTTSGTAAANLLPACVEARYAGVPLVCMTADRPPELADTGASQTIDQSRLLTPALWFADLHAYEEATPERLRSAAHLGAQAIAFADSPPGPVQVNVRFREPLTPSAEAREERPRAAGSPLRRRSVLMATAEEVAQVSALLGGVPRGLIYCGHSEDPDPRLGEAVAALATAAGYPVIAEATSRLRGRLPGAVTVDAAEALANDETFASTHRPEVVVRLGKAPLTRAVSEWLAGVPQILISRDMPWQDPTRAASAVLQGDATPACEALAATVDGANRDPSWLSGWGAAQDVAGQALAAFATVGDDMFEGTVARILLEEIPDDALVYTATSLPIRALDAFWPSGRAVEVLASRGASGIDGTMSAALGAAAATGRPTVCFAGDLAFLHDVGGLLAVARHRIPLITVVVDNSGGGIFEFLPQAASIERETFEDLFVASHEIDLMRAAELYGAHFAAARDATALRRILKWSFTEGGAWVVRVPVDRATSVRLHAGAWDRVSRALSEG